MCVRSVAIDRFPMVLETRFVVSGPTPEPKGPRGLLWLDLETSGLDPEVHRILEIACFYAPFDRPFDAEKIFSVPINVGVNEEVTISPYVMLMHEKNGLLLECFKSEVSLSDVEVLITNEMSNRGLCWLDKDEKVVLAGSTIHFDHSFLRKHMPMLNAQLSHRHYDVSSIKLFCTSLGMPKPPKAEAHRAEADVLESIDHARRCVLWLNENGP